MLRALIISVALITVASPASAQETPPPAYTYAPAPAAGTTSYFAPRDRHGRSLVGTRMERRNDRGMWGLGLGLFIAGYVLDVAGTAIFNGVSNDRDGALEEDAMAWSILPWFGPVIQLFLGAPHPALPIMSGLMQIGGTILFALGLTTENEVEIPVYAWGDPSDPRTMRVGLDLMPTDGGAAATLTLHTM